MPKSAEEKKSLKDWLDTIQQDSWQLELIISGVVIFLMLGAYEPIMGLRQQIRLNVLSGSGLLAVAAGAYGVFLVAYFCLLLIFMLHLVLRGLWIGAIGLRSVSGDFDYEVLDYQPRFKQWLRQRLGSFDDYIERLETQCSVAFSFAFLMFFAVLSLGSYTLVVVSITLGVATLLGADNPEAGGWQTAVTAFVNIFILLIGLIYLIDFSSLGWFKKRRWLLKVYFPFYRFMGWLTLARFYRPFYYNMIDHPFGRKLVKWLWLIIFGSLFAASITIVRYPYFPYSDSSATVATAGTYLDKVPVEEIKLNSPSLGSRYASEDYLEVFIPYLGAADDRVIQQLYPNMAPALTGSFAVDGPVNLWSARNPGFSADSLLLAHQALHRLYLNDSLITDIDWQFYEHPLRRQKGLLYDLPVYALPRGKHLLRFDRYQLNARDSLYWQQQEKILFVR